MFLNTPEDVEAHLPKIKPVYIPSKDGRQIVVPCMNTVLVKRELIRANTYNPNDASSKLDFIVKSIAHSGFTYPVSVCWDGDLSQFVIVDGFHRWRVCAFDYLGLEHVPVAILDLTPSERMVATIQFNKARGFHQVDLDAEVIRMLIEQGMNENEIADELQLDLDTVHRYKQLTGVAALFKNAQYSTSWDMMEVD